jgi:hypothetical protein
MEGEGMNVRYFLFGLTIALVSLTLSPVAASATEPTHTSSEDTFAFTSTGLCSFPVRIRNTSSVEEITYFDANGNPTYQTLIVAHHSTFRNTQTGTTLFARGHYISAGVYNGAFSLHGLSENVKDASGRTLFTVGGTERWDENFNIVSYTPHFSSDVEEQLLCAALS